MSSPGTRMAVALRRSALAALLLGALVAGCGDSDEPSPARGGTLVIDANYGQLSTLDPHSLSPTVSLYINHARFTTLLTFDGSDTRDPRPALAESYEASPDAKVFTFQLRDDATFADGTPITSEDVVFSLNRVLHFELGTQVGPAMFPGKVTFEADGPSTVIMRSEKPAPFTPAVMTTPQMSIINAKLAKAHGANDTGKKDTASPWLTSGDSGDTSSGPYKLSSFVANKEIVLTRNAEYWGAPAAYDRIVIRNVAAPAQLLQVQRGKSELALDVGATEVARLKGNDRVSVSSTPSANLLLFFLNNDPKISTVTSNAKLREAVRYAIDYDRIVELAGEGAAQATGIFPRSYHGSLGADQAIDQDLDRAKQAYAESGASEPFTLYYGTDSAVAGVQTSIIAQSVKSDLDAAGIEAKIVGAPISTVFQKAFIQHELDASFFPTWPVIPNVDEIGRWVPGGHENLTAMAGYPDDADVELRELADRALSATSVEERVALFEDVQLQLNERGPWVPLVNPAQVFVSTRSVALPEYHPIWIVDLADVQPAD